VLLYLPFCEPSFVERDANIDAERVLGNKVLGRRVNPLSADVDDGTAEILVLEG
jgi:hypothetical protein